MRRTIWFSLIVAGLGMFFAPVARAQHSSASAEESKEHGQIGIFADYFRMKQIDSNFAGLGGRVSFNMGRYSQLEAEMSYDFNQVFTEGFTDTTTGSVTLTRSNLRLLHGLFGPKFQTGNHPIRFFVTVKGGFINTRFDSRPATLATFTSTVEDLRSQNVNGAVYPGGGIEAHIGPIGLRLEAGDEMYFNHGVHHNVRVMFGPYIRF